MILSILDKIEKKTEAEVERIQKENEDKINSLKKEFEKLKSDKREKLLSDLGSQKDKKLTGVLNKNKLNKSFSIEKEKSESIEEIYSEVIDNIVDHPKYADIIKNLISGIKGDGKYIAGPKTQKLLGVDSDSMKDEGFIFEGDYFELDFRISQLLSQIKEKSDPELLKILF